MSAAQAAAYWSAANSVCETERCTAIAGDFVDDDPDQAQPSFPSAAPPTLTYNNHLATYENAYVTALDGAVPAIWGFHPYFAVNCEQSASVTTFEEGLPARSRPNPSPQIWFTEVAAWECVTGQSPARGTAGRRRRGVPGRHADGAECAARARPCLLVRDGGAELHAGLLEVLRLGALRGLELGRVPDGPPAAA